MLTLFYTDLNACIRINRGYGGALQGEEEGAGPPGKFWKFPHPPNHMGEREGGNPSQMFQAVLGLSRHFW